MVRIHLSPPLRLPRSQVVRHQTLTLTCVSSNLTEAAIMYDLLAQSVEHLTFNQRVMSSNLIQVTSAWVAELVDAQDLKSCEIQPSCRFKSGLRHHFKNYSLLFIVDEFFYKIYYYFISNNYWHSLNCCVIINLSFEKTFGGIPKSGWRDRSWKPGGRASGAGIRIPFPPPQKVFYRGVEQSGQLVGLITRRS